MATTSFASRLKSNAFRRAPPRPAGVPRARPAPTQPVAGPKGQVLPTLLQGSRSAASIMANLIPKGNAQAEMKRRNMPQTFASEMRSADLDRRFGPIIGSRAQMATVASFQGVEGLDGFSFSKLTNWVGKAASAISSGNPANMIAVAAAAIPGGKTPAVLAPPVQKPPVVQPTQVEQMFTSMKPQNTTQTMMMVGAGVLGLGLVALILRRR
jgi:hypothetical protein